MHYLKGLEDFSICYHVGSLKTKDYRDAYWGSDSNERKPTFGYILLLNRRVIFQCSKKHKSIALLMNEVEFLVGPIVV